MLRVDSLLVPLRLYIGMPLIEIHSAYRSWATHDYQFVSKALGMGQTYVSRRTKVLNRNWQAGFQIEEAAPETVSAIYSYHELVLYNTFTSV